MTASAIGSRLVLLMGLVAFAAHLAGCGGGGTSDGTVGGQGPQASVPEGDGGDKAPPDPGAAGMVSLEGIDADRNGVRDDVDLFVVTTYADSARMRGAARQIARALQGTIAIRTSATESIGYMETVNKALACARLTRPVTYSKEFNKVLAMQLNTKERVIAYAEFDKKLIAQPIRMPKENTPKSVCVFDWTGLPN